MSQSHPSPPRPRVILGVTGASGAIYGRALLGELLKLDVEIHLIVSPASQIVLREETGLEFPGGKFDLETYAGCAIPPGRVVMHSDGDLAAPPAKADDLLALDEALEQLARQDSDAVAVVKLRYFAGLSVEEAADTLGMSRATAYRHWTFARAWLLQELRGDEPA